MILGFVIDCRYDLVLNCVDDAGYFTMKIPRGVISKTRNNCFLKNSKPSQYFVANSLSCVPHSSTHVEVSIVSK